MLSDIILWFRRLWARWFDKPERYVTPARLFGRCSRRHGYRQCWCQECGWRRSAWSRGEAS